MSRPLQTGELSEIADRIRKKLNADGYGSYLESLDKKFAFALIRQISLEVRAQLEKE